LAIGDSANQRKRYAGLYGIKSDLRYDSKNLEFVFLQLKDYAFLLGF